MKLLALLSFVCAFFLRSAFSSVLVTVAGNEVVAGTSDSVIHVRIDSSFAVRSIEALLDGAPISGVFDLSAADQFALVTLPDVPEGAHDLSVRVTDILSNVGSGVQRIFYYKRIALRIDSPKPPAIGFSNVRISITSTDNRGPTKMVGTLADNAGSRIVFTATNSVSYDQPVSGAGLLTVISTVWSARSTNVLQLFGSPIRNIYPEIGLPGNVLDISNDKYLFESNGVVCVADHTGSIQLRSPPPLYGSAVQSGFLTEYGAIYQQSDPRGTNLIYELDVHGTTLLSSGTLRKKGDLAGYCTPWGDLFVRNLHARQSQLRAQNVSSNSFDISKDGNVVYLRQLIGDSVLFLNDAFLDEGCLPRIDGDLVVFTKSRKGPNGLEFAIFFHDSTGSHPLTQFVHQYRDIFSDDLYLVNSGWIAFAVPQLSGNSLAARRSPSGVFEQIQGPDGGGPLAIRALNEFGDTVTEQLNFFGLPAGIAALNGNPIGFPFRFFSETPRLQGSWGPAVFNLLNPRVNVRYENGSVVISSGLPISQPFVLQSTENLAGWTTNTQPLTNHVDRYELRTSATGAMNFFRLVDQ